MCFLLFMFPKTNVEGKGNVCIGFILPKTNVEGKGNVFLAFHASQDKR